MSTVLVTGGSGFVGGHCILQLLEAGHEVRATLRNLDRQADVLAMLKEGGAGPAGRLRFFAADLGADAGWTEAIGGCDYVLHVASPFPAGVPKHEDELIIPAREGALRVLRASREAGVKRVVLTSSFGAVGYGHAPRQGPFTELDWTDTGGADVQPYVKSKTLAEKAAWDFMAREGGALELCVINPVGIFGPVLGPGLSSSIKIVKSLMEGALPATPRIYFGVVDVRDVAALHLRAMTNPAAKGERFLAVAGDTMSMHQVAKALRRRLGPAAAKVPRWQMPDWLLRLGARRNPAARGMLPQLGKIRRVSNAKALRVLGWIPRSSEEALVASAESLLRLGLLKESPKNPEFE
jgi:dihydroflavonol-4-reductase